MTATMATTVAAVAIPVELDASSSQPKTASPTESSPALAATPTTATSGSKAASTPGHAPPKRKNGIINTPLVVLHAEDIIVSRPPTPPPLPSLESIMRSLDRPTSSHSLALEPTPSSTPANTTKSVATSVPDTTRQEPTSSAVNARDATGQESRNATVNSGDATAQDPKASAPSAPDSASNTPASAPPSVSQRPQRSRRSNPVYNISKLSGTDGHGKREAKGDVILFRRRAKSDRAPEASLPAASHVDTAPDGGEISLDSIDVKVSPGTLPRPFSRAQPGVERGPQRGPKQPKTAPEKPAQNRTPLARRTSDFTFRQAASPSSPSGRPVRAARISRAASTPAKGQASSSIRASPRSSGRVERLSLTRAASAKSAPPSVLGKRTRSSSEVKESLPVPVKLSRELRRLQDTNEFNHIDETPVVYTVWSRGKYVPPSKLRETGKPAAAKPDTKSPSKPAADSMPPAAKRQKTGKSDAKEEITETAPVVKELARKRPGHKQYLESGLYAGQEDNKFPYKGLTPAENKALPKSLYPPSKPNKVFPLPIFNGLRLLANGRDFKLPYDICNPLPPGQPKPEEWRKLTRNRFIGDAAAIYKKSPQYKEEMSKCVCKVEDGCADNCQNRIMLYECDETNCNVGPENCRNRAFADLQERVKGGGKYRIGVEVFKTADRGFGVRSNRCFQAGQIIMEYTGEIITEEECDRRMNEEYKHNKCYYLMSFDKSLIIDATTGSMARFVNHSCNPNCRMEKWMVSGQPRMALFAGDKPIMTGDELTYDYNFDPFSKKSIQQCLCGSDNCRGVLGPRKQEPKAPAKSNAKEAAKSPGKAGTKRKLSEMQGGEKASPRATKKARVVAAKAKGVAAKGVAAKGVAAKGVTAKTKGVAGKGVAAKSATVKSAMAKGVTAKGPTAKGATAKGATAKGATAKGKLIASKSKAGAYAATASKGKLGVRKSKPGASPAAKGKAKAVASAKKSTVTVKRITLKQSITVANRQGSAKKPSSQKADSARPVSVFSVRKKRVIIPSAKARAAAAEKSKSTANARAASGTVRTPKLKIVRKTKAAESSSEQDRAAPREDVDMEDAGPGEAEPSNVEIRVNVERGAEPEAVKGTEAPRNLSDSEDNGIAAKDVMDIALEKRLAEKENQEQPWYKSIGRFVPGRPARPLPSPSPSNSSGEAGNGLASKEKRQTKLRLVATGSEGRALGFGDNVNVDMDPYSDFDHTAGQSAAQATKMAAPVPG